MSPTDRFNQNELYICKIMQVEYFDNKDCKLSFVKCGIFKATENENEFIHCISGRIYKIFSRDNLKVKQKGILKNDIILFKDYFKKSYANKPDLINHTLSIIELMQLEKKITKKFINEHSK